MRDFHKVNPKLWKGTLGKAWRGDAVSIALAFHLLTHPDNTELGVFRVEPWEMAGALGFDLGSPFEAPSKPLRSPLKGTPKGSATIFEALRKLEALGFIVYDYEEAVVWVVEQARHNFEAPVSATDNRSKGFYRLLEDFAKSFIVNAFLDRYSGHLSIAWRPKDEAPSKPLRSPFEAPSKPLGTEGEGEREEEKEEEKTKTAAEPAVARHQKAKRQNGDPGPFAEFWSVYPRKVGKPAAEAAFAKHPDPAKIIAGAKRWAAYWAQDQTEDRYIPHPATWLNQARFNDEPPKPRNGIRRAIASVAAPGDRELQERHFRHKVLVSAEVTRRFSEYEKAHGTLPGPEIREAVTKEFPFDPERTYDGDDNHL